MKRFKVVFMLICSLVLFFTPSVSEAFNEKPVAFIVIDRSGNVKNEVYDAWRQPARWAYFFLNYYLLDNTERINEIAMDNIVIQKRKMLVNEAAMQKIAQEIPADVVVLVLVKTMNDRIVTIGPGWNPDAAETYVKTFLNSDIYIYKKDGNKFSKKNVWVNDLVPLGNQKIGRAHV